MNSFLLVNSPARPRGADVRPKAVSPDGQLLRLLSSGDGWSLVSRDGALVYSALGVSGRHRCLKFAQEQGVVALGA